MIQMIFVLLDNFLEGRRYGEICVKGIMCFGIVVSLFGQLLLGEAFIMIGGVIYMMMGGLSLFQKHVQKKDPMLRYSLTLPFNTVVLGLSLAGLVEDGLAALVTQNSLALWGLYLALLVLFTNSMLPSWIRRVD
jgi:hypothetical protein